MAGRIRDEDVAAVNERTDIVKLVSGYLTLKKAGHDRFVGLCPFHTEKTPSFGVSPSKGLYHCFGCGKGGDAIGFLRDVEHLEFAEAVERLAKEVGVALRYEGDTPAERRVASKRQALVRANEAAFELYHRTLLEAKEGEEARRYLETRGIDREVAAEFEIGYAPAYPDFLLRRLVKSLSAELLVEAGLALKDQEGNVRDRFRRRITFPVHDLSGKAVGIGARILPGGREDGPKYLNSPETPVYRKAEVLYNLQRAKASATRSGEVFLVEGYTDVIAMVRAGVPNTVATCGTALGEGHFRLASRFAQRMVLAFDSDDAGARAAERAFEFVERFPVQPVVLILPEGLDPADFVDQHGGESAPRARGRRRPARRVHGATDGGPPRPLDDRGAERGGRRGGPPARAARRPRATERVRAPARRARGGLGGFRRAQARTSALGTPGRGPAGRQARLGAGAGRARDAADPGSGRRRVPFDRAPSIGRALPVLPQSPADGAAPRRPTVV